jgi:hypothetical protein
LGIVAELCFIEPAAGRRFAVDQRRIIFERRSDLYDFAAERRADVSDV